jgi:hypothetical protein
MVFLTLLLLFQAQSTRCWAACWQSIGEGLALAPWATLDFILTRFGGSSGKLQRELAP